MPRLNSNDNLFTSKLEEILEDPETHSVIRWGENKYTIEINDKTRLLEQILPKYFRHNRFESFVRQMNLYGFKKIRFSKIHCFINLDLKNGKRLTELKSKNQLKRQHDSDQASNDQSLEQLNRKSSEKAQDQEIKKQLFQFFQPSIPINTMENTITFYRQPSFQREMTYVYLQSLPQPYIEMNPMNNYSVYPYSYFVYQ